MSKEKLYKIITAKTGRPDYLAIELYLDIKSQTKKSKSSIFSYSNFTKKYKCSQDNIRRKLILLEKLGLVKRSFTKETLPSGYNLHNILNISLIEGGKQ